MIENFSILSDVACSQVFFFYRYWKKMKESSAVPLFTVLCDYINGYYISFLLIWCNQMVKLNYNQIRLIE